MNRMIAWVLVAAFVASAFVPRTACGQVITGGGETTTTSSSGDDGGSDDNTLSFVLLGAVIAVVLGVSLAYSRDSDVVEIRQQKADPAPVGLFVKDEAARDVLAGDAGAVLTAGLAYNAEF